MKITCLCPTYGRTQEMLNNTLACFADQTYKDATLVLHDDLGTLANTKVDCPNVYIMSTTKRSPSVAQKFNEIIHTMNPHLGLGLVVWDDDDIYLPEYISTHVEVLNQDYHWSKPSRIISAYHSPPQEEDATGRFHGSIAIRTEYLWMVNGWINTIRGTYDQEMLARLGAEPAGDPCKIAPPQYIYRWQTSQAGHCSGLMNHEDWYERYQPDSRKPIDKLWPEYSPGAIRDMQGVQAEPKRYLPSTQSNLS